MGIERRDLKTQRESRTRYGCHLTHITPRGSGTCGPNQNRAREPIFNRLARISFHICILNFFHFSHIHSHQHQYICLVSTRGMQSETERECEAKVGDTPDGSN